MDQNELKRTIESMISAASACPELKKAGQDYLNAGTEEERGTAKANLIQELKEDIATIDQLLDFLHTPFASKMFGEELRLTKIKEESARKTAGEKWCDCPACALGLVVLENESLL